MCVKVGRQAVRLLVCWGGGGAVYEFHQIRRNVKVSLYLYMEWAWSNWG